MSASSRISLHDCAVEVSIPFPSSLSATSKTTSNPVSTPEEATLLAIESQPLERTEAYVGDTLFLVVTITGPAGANCTTDSLYQALDAFGDVQVFMGRSRSAHSCSLPVLRESAWIGTSRSDEENRDALPFPSAPVLLKGVWALVRTPPEQSELADVISVAGKQEIIIVLREKSVSHGLRNSPVWATIDRASRLFGKTIALTASKPLMIELPLDISCEQVRVGECSEKEFVSITARNTTGNAILSIVPPYINVNSSKVVEDPQVNPKFSKSNAGLGGVADIQIDSDEFEMSLDERYEFVPMFSTNETGEDEDSFDDLTPNPLLELGRSKSAGGVSTDDYGLFIPSFNHWLKRAVALGPREVFNFVYKVVQKGDSQHKTVAGDSLQTNQTSLGRKKMSSMMTKSTRKLKPGTCLETSVAVAWNCTPLETASGMPGTTPDKQEMLQREMSSGGVLATGKRGNVAIRLTSIHWRPSALLDGVIITLAGPSVASVGSNVSVSISILNQTRTDMQDAMVFVQQDDRAVEDLLALRTVIAVGRIAAGSEATLQLPCLALRAGSLSLGLVQVVDRGNTSGQGCVWTSEATFEVFVVRERAAEKAEISSELLATKDSPKLEAES